MPAKPRGRRFAFPPPAPFQSGHRLRGDERGPWEDEHGFLDPVKAAAHAVVVQGGFSTPPIEAYRMIRDGGVMRERALAWLAKYDLDPADPREGKDTPWPLPDKEPS